MVPFIAWQGRKAVHEAREEEVETRVSPGS